MEDTRVQILKFIEKNCKVDPKEISGAVSCYFEIEIKPDHLSQVTDILYKNDTVTQIYLWK